MEEEKQIIVESQSVEYLKLMKNSKGYNWEIKQLSLNIDEIEKINNEMLERFGSTNHGN